MLLPSGNAYTFCRSCSCREAGLVSCAKTVFVQDVVQRREQSGVNERLHLRGRVNHRDVRNFFGSRLRFQLLLLLVRVQRVELDRYVRVVRHVLVDQLVHRFRRWRRWSG